MGGRMEWPGGTADGRQGRPVMTAAPPRSGRFDSLGLKLHYLEWGRADAPPVLMIHGGLDHAWSWVEMAQTLAGDFRVLALDLRGHGDSDWSMGGDYHTHSFLGDIAAFARQVIGRPTSLIAHSMGARLGLYFAGAVPGAVARMVALEGLARPRMPPVGDGENDSAMRAWLEARLARQAAGHVAQVGYWLDARATYLRKPARPYASLEEAVARLLEGDDKKLTPAQAFHFAKTGMRAGADGRLTWKFDPTVKWHIGREVGEPQTRSYYANIDCPVLHIYGDQSWAYPPAPEDLACFRRHELVVIPGAGHWVHFNNPGAVAAEVRRFLLAAPRG
jgi:pimeloyl-ACP methyl ester carboxylesterase